MFPSLKLQSLPSGYCYLATQVGAAGHYRDVTANVINLTLMLTAIMRTPRGGDHYR